MAWKIKFRCPKCNEEIEWEVPKFTPIEASSIEGVGKAIARNLSLHLKGVKLTQEEKGKVREFRF
jgi:hypothetical protein